MTQLRIYSLIAAALCACTLSACNSTMMSALVQTVSTPFKSEANVNGARLNPIYRHLRVVVNRRTVFVTLGDLDKHPDGPIEVFYSAGREVIRMQNGRIVGATGLLTEWRNVTLRHAPTWTAASHAKEPLIWLRVRDVMPGYRFGIHDQIVLRAIAPPTRNALQGIRSDALAWFEERTEAESTLVAAMGSAKQNTAEVLPPARYAVAFESGREAVVYAEQCIAQDLCLTWQQWIPKKP